VTSVGDAGAEEFKGPLGLPRVGEAAWWPTLGFRGNPYDTRPLGTDPDSTELLVGRRRTVDMIESHLRSTSTHLAIDAPNGRGKTSVLRCVVGELDRSAERFEAGQLLVPVKDLVSPFAEEPAGEFAERVLLELAKTLVENRRAISRAGGSAEGALDGLYEFLASPLLRSGSFGISAGPFGGLTGGRGKAPNTGFAFRAAGLEGLVREALERAFPVEEAGALVVCLDDIEQVGNPLEVAEYLSAIRERLLRLHGVKWVLLGSGGVLDGLGSHRRLAGIVGNPMRLPELRGPEVAEVVERRISHYRLGTRVTVPIDGGGFRILYEAAGKRLRAGLQLCQEFARFAEERGALEDGSMTRAGRRDADGAWERLDVPHHVVEQFVEELCLDAWNQVANMGATAVELIYLLDELGGAPAEDLIGDDPAREETLSALLGRSLVVASQGVLDRSRAPLELSSAGSLAMRGATLAGWTPQSI
jgi:hypothetical protein